MDILDQFTEAEYAAISAAHDGLMAADRAAFAHGPDQGAVLVLRVAEAAFEAACWEAGADPAEVRSAL